MAGCFDYLRDLLKQRSGLVVTPEKMYLVEMRLMPVARSAGYATIDDMLMALRDNHDEKLVVEISEAMNTHESQFFRDKTPFEAFQNIMMPALMNKRQDTRRIRIWCAACSSGQEPYSLAMILDEMASQLSGWQVDVVATDISHSVLDRARRGVFSQLEVQRGLPVNFLMKHFTQVGEDWQLNENIRKWVTFRPLNLMESFKGLGQFDIIMCRNVLIYFDVETKQTVLKNIGKVLAADGVLLLGSAETTIGLCEHFWPVDNRRGLYKHVNSPTTIADGP